MDVFSFSDQTEDHVSEMKSRYTSTSVTVSIFCNIDGVILTRFQHPQFERSVDTITDTCVSIFDDHSVVEEVFMRVEKILIIKS